MKLEAVVIPVSEVDRVKDFHQKLGWRLDADFRFDNGLGVANSRRPVRGLRSSSADEEAQNLFPLPRAWQSSGFRLFPLRAVQLEGERSPAHNKVHTMVGERGTWQT